MRYSTIVADPPWEIKAGPPNNGFRGVTGSSRALPYSTMTVEQIAALRVADVSANDSHLYLWTVNRYVEDAFGIARSWGFKYSTLLTWAKNPMGGGLGGAFGISTEYILFCRRGSLAPIRRMDTTWFDWQRPFDARGKPMHSGKPGAFYAVVEGVSPGPYLDMFARTNRLGWDSWGNECLSVDLPLEAA
jgi:N6-adenosine-specific RNA methylase IME4